MTGWDALAARLETPEFLSKSGASAPAIRTSVEEARHALTFVDANALRTQRVLEVGAGYGLLACYLSLNGVQISALEPGECGFEKNGDAAARVREELGARYDLLRCRVEDLNEKEHGLFDVIFSNNVLEHVADPQAALAAMRRVLAPDGMMVHNCPNYAVPYEPHFRMPLVPFAPRLTAAFARKRIAEDEACWKSLNFVTAGAVRRAAAAIGCTVFFERELTYKALLRLESDAEFSERQRGLTGLAALLRKTGLLGLVRRLPPGLATPMVFTMRPKPAAGAARAAAKEAARG